MELMQVFGHTVLRWRYGWLHSFRNLPLLTFGEAAILMCCVSVATLLILNFYITGGLALIAGWVIILFAPFLLKDVILSIGLSYMTSSILMPELKFIVGIGLMLLWWLPVLGGGLYVMAHGLRSKECPYSKQYLVLALMVGCATCLWAYF